MTGPRSFIQAQTPAPVQRADNWRADANCAGLDTDLFIPDGKDNHVPHEVLRVCLACPVAQQCLDFAVTMKPEGFWAGTSAKGRRKLKVGDTPPMFDRVCTEDGCDTIVPRYRASRCDECSKVNARRLEAGRRQANRDAVAS